MIRFSKREDYGVILIGELARNFGQQPIPLSRVAKDHGIPLLFLRNIASDLRKAELVEAIEGKNGGYRLKKAPRNIQVGEVITALSSHPIFSCCQNSKDGKCSQKTCPHGLSLRRLHNEFLEKITHVSLDRLLK